MNDARFIPLDSYTEISSDEIINRSELFNSTVQKRRSVRAFSPRIIPPGAINNFLLAAGSAPSGANKQPWHFVVVSDHDVKSKIRQAAETEEKKFYDERATESWLTDLKPLGTNYEKPFLETASHLIVIFEKKYDELNGKKIQLYYTKESVGIATGILITAIHYAGLTSLTYSPGRMNFLNELLERPLRERPFLILALGYPADGTVVPDLKRKGLDETTTFI